MTYGEWPPMPNPFHDYDEPSSVRVFDHDDPRGVVRVVDRTPEPAEKAPVEGVGRLGRPWEREERADLEHALTAARSMRDDAEALIGWLGRFRPALAADNDYLIEDTDALIERLERMAAQL